MRNKAKLLLFFSVTVVFAVIIVMFICFSFEKSEPFLKKDDNSERLITVEEIPYYYYIESIFYDYDIDGIETYFDKTYAYDDYLISDYGDGIRLHAYYGKEKNVVIPEYIAGKKVLAFANHRSDLELTSLTVFAHPYEESNIVSIHIPAGVKDIAYRTFTSGFLKKLKFITVDENNPYYFSFCGMLFSKETNELLCAPMFNYSIVPEIIY